MVRYLFGALYRHYRIEAALVVSILVMVIGGLVLPWSVTAALVLVWVAGPVAVGSYFVGLLLGVVDMDGLAYGLAGLGVAVAWGSSWAWYELAPSGLGGVLFLAIWSFDFLALGPGLTAIERGRGGVTDTRTVQRSPY